MDKLTIRRSQPVQGQPVRGEIYWNDQPVGLFTLPFAGWLKFNRLLAKGIELDGRENYGLKVKLSIRGIEVPEPELEPAVTTVVHAKPMQVVHPLPYRGGVSELAREEEDDLDEDDRKAVEQQVAADKQAETQQARLIRSLRPESEETDGK